MPAPTVRARPGLLRAFACMVAFAGLAAHAQTPLQTADGEWPMAARDYANTRYSALDQINTGKVPPFEYSIAMGVRRGDTALRDRLDEVLKLRKADINAILDAYFLPRWAMSARAAGVLPNSADSLEKWIMHPRAINPHTAMPELGVSAAEARDIAAYLYSQ